MTKKRIYEIYRFLAVASMKRLTDEEKFALIRLLRQMKPASKELGEAINDAVQQAMTDGVANIDEFVSKAVADIENEETNIDVRIMTDDAFQRLALSNDWNFGQIDELQEIMVKE